MKESLTLGGTPTTTPTETPTPNATARQTPVVSNTPSVTPTASATLSASSTPTPVPQGPITIDYIYDPLNRLIEANYSNGDYYHYGNDTVDGYDAVGNRLWQETRLNGVISNTTYTYDTANRLTSVNGILYTWDDNGNLRNDGVNTYGYDLANRLVTLTGPSSANYSYNGLGDRLQETLNGQPTTFIMDLNTGLTQALSDGTNHYIYGVDRIAQTQGGATDFFLGDALGSVRQLTNANGSVTLTKSYAPYGNVAQSLGSAQTSYGFTNEYTSQGLIYLRSRYYSPESGRFLTKDTWEGDINRPLSFNKWMYVEGNPINRVDPTGYNWQPPNYCQMMPTKGLYELCILSKYGLVPIDLFSLGATVTGQQGCYSGPTAYRAPGYLEGVDVYYGGWPMLINGKEVVYDFATMERSNFKYWGVMIGSSINLVGGSAYTGHVNGFTFATGPVPSNVVRDYRDVSFSLSYGVSLGEGGSVGLGRTAFVSGADWMLNGKTLYVSASIGANLLVVLDVSGATVTYSPTSGITSYAQNGSVDRGRLANDILSGAGSPGSFWKEYLKSYGVDVSRPIIFTDITAGRVLAWLRANHYADAYEAMWKINHP